MNSTKRRIELQQNNTFHIMLMSDLHVGSAFIDYSAITDDLEKARAHNARIILNGDIMECLYPSNRKQFSLNSVHPRLRCRDDMMNEELAMCIEILLPYADLIDVIGVGNHDDRTRKFHSVDMVSLLVSELNRQAGTDIEYGGFCGFVSYLPSLYKSTVRAKRLAIYYHHGTSGSSPVTLGTIAFSRVKLWVRDVDIITMGHSHSRWAIPTQTLRLNQSGSVVSDTVLCVTTGSYFKNVSVQSQESVGVYGRIAQYAQDRNFGPSPMGGVLISVAFERKSRADGRQIERIINAHV